MSDLISRQAAIDAMRGAIISAEWEYAEEALQQLPSAQPEQEDYTEMKREFIRMAEYIDALLKVSDGQKETLIGVISRLAEFVPWTERDFVVDAIEKIRGLPSAQPKKVGKWIIDGHHIRCSVCDVYMCNTDREGDKIPTTFCPNCGAKMEEQDE